MNGVNWTEIFTLVAAIATALGTVITSFGVFLAWQQIKASKQLNQTQFEDSLAREYRDVIVHIPANALLGEKLTSDQQKEALIAFYRYVDLTNNQIFLRQQGRVDVRTWQNWRDGIKSLMTMPAFSEAWNHIKQKPTTKFEELRRFEESHFRDDPNDWNEENDMVSSDPLLGKSITAKKQIS